MTTTLSIHATLRQAATALKHTTAEPESARFEAQLLLQHALNVNRAWLLAHANDALSTKDFATFETLINRRIAGEPIAYILGYREFYGLKLTVSPHTLIPRPDTETLVETALAKMPDHQPLSVCDLGTGTGAIGLAIANNRPMAKVTAVDFSEHALAIARQNAKHLMLVNCHFLQSHWFSALNEQQFDLIVSNPPYIEAQDPHLNQGDLRFEPLSALASGKDGLEDIRQIIDQAPSHLKPNGWLIIEHGFQQAAMVSDLFKNRHFTDISHALDLAGIQRVTLGKFDHA
jgi:release factor glutamine methyltransferase